ncbi:hypothetical protein GGTG_12263 [Gaeumannomyces tritici R3-111a-1]|uniref:Uncharacterized protein n=1 Tax=Gaeumannomyces tritici (strain R3-111a-1) TaxID=644352 RepID=J3PFI8_GAET3|nr:hypothetical protein GGTG_12263 [Gaeumannomyces tritici R3-111a-1]EJT70090.1 hypothetical protein GGTG_12263 [Gaeumannomyces tritici R3-111a-1]
MESPLPPPNNNPSPPPAKIGRPPQWTESRSRKLARLYMFTTLPIKKIIKVLEDVGFKPGPNSAQKTLHNMLGHDPRYLRPENREEMNERIGGLSASNSRRGSNPRSPLSQTEVQGTATDTPRSRASSGVGHSAVSDPEMLDEAIGFGSGKRYLPDSKGTFTFEASSPYSHTQTPSQLSPLHIDTAWSAEGSVAYGSPPAGLVESQSSYQSSGFAPKPLKHTTTMFSASTTASTPSLRSLKNRMSINSTTFAKHVSSLIRQFTIGSDSNLVNSLNTGADYQRSGASGYDRLDTKPLPGDFFTVYSTCEHEPAKWQEVVDGLSDMPDFWVTPSGHLSETAKAYLHHPMPDNFSVRDCFGNTPLHLFAQFVDCAYMLTLVRLCTAEQLCSSNTAGQTFLHVLSNEWFQNLDDQSAPLLQLLFYVRGACPAIVAQCDVYGRTFFHHMQAMVSDPTLMSIVMRTCDASFLPRRDAFDTKPAIAEGTSFGLTGGPRHTQALSPLPEEVVGSPVSAASPIQEMDMFTQHHAGLLRTVTAADTNPTVEDACGRNALHCLAEVILGDKDTLQERHSTLNSYRPPKRKFDQRGAGKTDADGVDGSPNTAAADGPMARRLGFLRGLLALQGMDANHYDRSGNTALMAFIQHLTDQDEDRNRSLLAMLQLLITDGGARVEARNARGETALLMAARLGRKTALQLLLQRGGANVHARDADGKGALDLIDEACPRSKGDTQLYGRLQACRVLLTGRYKDEWATGGDQVLQSPTAMDEWRVRAPRSGCAVFQ